MVSTFLTSYKSVDQSENARTKRANLSSRIKYGTTRWKTCRFDKSSLNYSINFVESLICSLELYVEYFLEFWGVFFRNDNFFSRSERLRAESLVRASDISLLFHMVWPTLFCLLQARDAGWYSCWAMNNHNLTKLQSGYVSVVEYLPEEIRFHNIMRIVIIVAR